MGSASGKRRHAQRLAKEIYDRQVVPQQRARELRARGYDVEAGFVDVGKEATGFEVMCEGCGRTGRVPFELPGGQLAFCPDCLSNVDTEKTHDRKASTGGIDG